jgi:hypothetical protein
VLHGHLDHFAFELRSLHLRLWLGWIVFPIPFEADVKSTAFSVDLKSRLELRLSERANAQYKNNAFTACR